MDFNAGDKVKVITKNSIHEGKTGTVRRVLSDELACTLQLDEDPQGLLVGFFLSELEQVDVKREALIELAETLDKARLQANAIEETANQNGVYGSLFDALTVTLTLLTDGYVGALIYEAMLDGNTVREALAVVVK